MIRKVVLHPFTLAFLFVGIGAGIAGQIAVSLLGLILAIASVAYLSIRETKSLRDEGTLEDLSNEERSQLAPLRKIRNEIAQVVQERNEDVSIAVVGAEAIQEADRILEQCAKLVQLRRNLKRSLFSSSQTTRELQSLQQDLQQADSEEEQRTLEQALEARKLEFTHYEGAQSSLERIDANLRQAQAALSEMKARLSTTSVTENEDSQTSELEETMGRLKSLGTSLEEAEEFLKGKA